jgi:type IV pilus biogenesis protein CpaD/CtpE
MKKGWAGRESLRLAQPLVFSDVRTRQIVVRREVKMEIRIFAAAGSWSMMRAMRANLSVKIPPQAS